MEGIILTVIMGFIVAAVFGAFLSLSKRIKIKLPGDRPLTGCPKCGAIEEYKPGMTPVQIATDSPVIRDGHHSGVISTLITAFAIVGGMGGALFGGVAVIAGVAAWLGLGGQMDGRERIIVGFMGVIGGGIAVPVGALLSTWGFRRMFARPVVNCKSCGWKDPKYAG